MNARFGRLTGVIVAGALVLGCPLASYAQASKELTLISAGQKPRKKLRFKLRKGTVQHIRVTTDQSMSMTIGAQSMPSSPMPKTAMTMKMAVKNVSKKGINTVTFRTVDVEVLPTPGVPPALVAQMGPALEPLKSLEGLMKFDGRGGVISADIELKDKSAPPAVTSMMDSLKDNVSQLVVPLPREAVGVGAKWRVSQEVANKQLNLPMTQQVLVTVTRIAGNTIELSSKVLQEVREGPIQLPNIPPAMTVRTKPSKSSGKGSMRMNLTKPGAEGDIDLNINVKMVMSAQGQTQEMNMNMAMKMDMKEIPASKRKMN